MFCVFPEHLHSSSIHLHIPTYVNIYTQSEESAQISQKQDERNIYAIYIYIYITNESKAFDLTSAKDNSNESIAKNV